MNALRHIFLACAMIAAFDAHTQTDTLTNKSSISDALLINTRLFRERLISDPYRPAYHFAFPEVNGMPGDPNGAFYHNGRYHLMYLYNRVGSGFHWGHVSSTDLLHWRNHPDAIMPGNGDEGCFSGGAFVDDDGSVTLSYWMLWGAKGIGLAKSTDANFDHWSKSEHNPIIKSSEWGITDLARAPGDTIHIGSADPSNIWKKDGKYYMVTGNLLVLRKYGSRGEGLPANPGDGPALPADSVKYQGDHLYLFSSTDMKNWNYLHEFYTSRRTWTEKTEDNMCPSFLPLPLGPDGGKPSGKHLLLFISHNKGAQYYVGDYKNDHFYPSTHGRMTWKDNAYFAPEALIDGKGRQIMWSWIFDDRPDSLIRYYGWTGMYGLPRTLWVGDDGNLRMRPVKELEALRTNGRSTPAIQVKKNGEADLQPASAELMEYELNFDPTNASQYGVKICMSADGREETLIYYDQSDKKLKVDTRKSGLSFGRKTIEEAPLELKQGEGLKLRIYIDRSIVEVFANDRQAIARTIYPTLGGRGLMLFSADGSVKVNRFRSWELSPSNPF